MTDPVQVCRDLLTLMPLTPGRAHGKTAWSELLTRAQAVVDEFAAGDVTTEYTVQIQHGNRTIYTYVQTSDEARRLVDLHSQCDPKVIRQTITYSTEAADIEVPV